MVIKLNFQWFCANTRHIHTSAFTQENRTPSFDREDDRADRFPLRRRQIAWDPEDIFYSPPLRRLVYFILVLRARSSHLRIFAWRKIGKWKEEKTYK